MREPLRRIRAALGMGLTWAASWAPIGLLIGLVIGGNSRTPDEAEEVAAIADSRLVPPSVLEA